MTDNTATTDSTTPAVTPINRENLAEDLSHSPMRRGQIERLLAELRDITPSSEPVLQASQPDLKFENRLAMVRLGIATSLFYSLRAKHLQTAAHCLRVALSCSSWAHRLGLNEAQRDRIEVSALLHDLGKIGIPDRILRKPGKLTVEEQLTMDTCARLGCEILRGCTNDVELLDIVRYANTWFESRRYEDGPSQDALPLGARMLAIADAFDAMTTDHVYRPALSREQAIRELVKGSGSQFDPELAIDFCRMLEQRPEILQGVVADRWLKQLQGESAHSFWIYDSTDQSQPRSVAMSSHEGPDDRLFLSSLVDKLKDGIVFADSEGTIIRWNDAMHRLTSIASDAILGRTWSEETVRLRELDHTRKNGESLVDECLRTAASFSRRMLIEQPGRTPTPVQVQVSQVSGDAPGSRGVVLVMQDLSDQAMLEEKVDTLHIQTTRDPLTGVGNRAFFDDQLAALTRNAASGGKGFSLIICDIDHFKRVNDVYGHPAGDEALIQFASILESHSRDGDVVARYGGEEFLLIAANCDNATATKRAETLRASLEKTSLPSLGGEAVTASFGVTAYQAGDSPQTILARADRALLKAKDNGRNRVIQLGSGNSPIDEPPAEKSGWFSWFDSSAARQSSEIDLMTPVPVDLAIEKLRGFIADHDAEVIRVAENQVSLKINVTCSDGGRRRIDHIIALDAQLTLSEQSRSSAPASAGKRWTGTKVHVSIRPIRNRDRRSRALQPCIAQLNASLKSYLMGEVMTE